MFATPVLAALLAACGPTPSPGARPPGALASASAPVASASSAPSSAPHLPGDIDLEVTLSPEPGPTPVVRVTITARPADAPLTLWTSSRAIELAEEPRAVDARGAVPVSLAPPTNPTGIVLDRPTDGVVQVSYTVRASLPGYPDVPAIAVDPDRFEAAGESLLFLPASLDDKPVRVALRVETDEIGAGPTTSAATSFGHGTRVDTVARTADVRESFFMAGLLGKGTFRAPEGNDDAAWLGYTAFDPRPIFADMAGLRTALTQIFRAPDAEKLTFLILSDSRPPGSFTVTRRPRSVVTRVGVQEAWTAPVRIAVAAAVVHGWIGSRLWIGPTEPAREPLAYWFSEGVTRHFARDRLFRYGLITPAEAAAEVEGLASLLATSPLARLPRDELLQQKGATPIFVARGALYALRIDALLRASKTEGTPPFELLLRDLYQRAAAQKGPLPETAWLDAVRGALGDSETATFQTLIDQGKPIDLPDSALGPCFRKVTRTYVGFDLGFDEEASMRAAPRRLKGLVKGGPAEKAGLREGDEIQSLHAGARSPAAEVSVTVLRDGKATTVRYKPEGRRAKGQGFERKQGVPDADCTN
ncbi:MAG: hypothetical protein R3B70_05315 [Polyangiaceae bacterium]